MHKYAGFHTVFGEAPRLSLCLCVHCVDFPVVVLARSRIGVRLPGPGLLVLCFPTKEMAQALGILLS